jgi:hypothetical protein
MEYRIQKDSAEPPIYWIEKLADNNWQRVFGTTCFSAGESWTALQNQEAIVSPAEVAMLLRGEQWIRDEPKELKRYKVVAQSTAMTEFTEASDGK